MKTDASPHKSQEITIPDLSGLASVNLFSSQYKVEFVLHIIYERLTFPSLYSK